MFLVVPVRNNSFYEKSDYREGECYLVLNLKHIEIFWGVQFVREILLYTINKVNYHIFENRVIWIGKMKVKNTGKVRVNYQKHYPEKWVRVNYYDYVLMENG